MLAESCPTDPHEVDETFLTRLLRRVGAIVVASVTDRQLQTLEPAPPGLRVLRIRLEYDLAEAGSPRSVLALFASTRPAERDFHHALGRYERVCLGFTDPGPEGPRCLVSSLNGETGEMLLLLEDPIWRGAAGQELFERLAFIFEAEPLPSTA